MARLEARPYGGFRKVCAKQLYPYFLSSWFDLCVCLSCAQTKAFAIFAYFLLFNIGISYLYNFVMHVFFAEMSAAFIGWENSPFQYEVGFASLGFGIVGLLAFRQNLAFRAAAIIGPSFFLWGAAGGHVYQMIISHNFAPGNAGIIFWTDIILPILAFGLLNQQYRLEKLRASPNAANSAGVQKRRS